MASTLKVKSLFFDRKVVKDAMSAATANALSKIGAIVRRTAKTSMGKKRRTISPAGSPPSVHEGSLQRLLFFSYDPAKKSVVIGPVPFRKGEAPRVLEFGGSASVKNRKGVTRRAVYLPRPFMGPALKKNMNVIPEQFRGSLKS